VRVQAVGASDLLELAFDLEERRLAESVGTAEGDTIVARLLELCEELADLCGLVFGGAEVKGALASIVAIDESVVGSEAAGAAIAVGGDDGADAGEDAGVSADEVEGRRGHGAHKGLAVSVRAYKYTDLQLSVNREIGRLRRFMGGLRYIVCEEYGCQKDRGRGIAEEKEDGAGERPRWGGARKKAGELVTGARSVFMTCWQGQLAFAGHEHEFVPCKRLFGRSI
jgi:hypothetical protein